MDIEIHRSQKEIGISRPEEFGNKVINLKNCKYIKLYPLGKDKYHEFLEIEIYTRIKKNKRKGNRIRTVYKIRGNSALNIKPEVSNSFMLEQKGFFEDE